MVNTRRVSIRWARNILNYVKKPLSGRRDSILAYRLLLRFISSRYNVNVDGYLARLKTVKSNVDLYVPDEKTVKESFLRILELGNSNLMLVFKLLLCTGLRQSEVVYLLKNLSGLEKSEHDDIIVYKLSLFKGTKHVFYAFVPCFVELKQINVNQYYYTTAAKRHNLIAAKYIRKFVATKMYSLSIPAEIVDFIQGRTPRSILTKHYLNLLSLAINYYKVYARWLGDFLCC